MADKRKLVAEELSRCQKLQSSKLLASPDDADFMGYHRSQFHCQSELMGSDSDRLVFPIVRPSLSLFIAKSFFTKACKMRRALKQMRKPFAKHLATFEQ